MLLPMRASAKIVFPLFCAVRGCPLRQFVRRRRRRRNHHASIRIRHNSDVDHFCMFTGRAIWLCAK